MKRKSKRIIALLMLVTVALGSVLMLSGCDGEQQPTAQGTGTAQASKETAAKATEPATNLGDYNVEIESCRLAVDYSNEDIVIVKYKFTNVNDDDAASFDFAISDNVYQDGVSLNNCYFADESANYNSDNASKKIKKGASIEVEVAYELNDSETDIVVEISELFSLFDDTVITKTFSIK